MIIIIISNNNTYRTKMSNDNNCGVKTTMTMAMGLMITGWYKEYDRRRRRLPRRRQWRRWQRWRRWRRWRRCDMMTMVSLAKGGNKRMGAARHQKYNVAVTCIRWAGQIMTKGGGCAIVMVLMVMGDEWGRQQSWRCVWIIWYGSAGVCVAGYYSIGWLCVFHPWLQTSCTTYSRGDLISGGRPLVAGVYAVICCGCMTEYRLWMVWAASTSSWITWDNM